MVNTVLRIPCALIVFCMPLLIIECRVVNSRSAILGLPISLVSFIGVCFYAFEAVLAVFAIKTVKYYW